MRAMNDPKVPISLLLAVLREYSAGAIHASCHLEQAFLCNIYRSKAILSVDCLPSLRQCTLTSWKGVYPSHVMSNLSI